MDILRLRICLIHIPYPLPRRYNKPWCLRIYVHKCSPIARKHLFNKGECTMGKIDYRDIKVITHGVV